MRKRFQTSERLSRMDELTRGKMHEVHGGYIVMPTDSIRTTPPFTFTLPPTPKPINPTTFGIGI